jgi:DNA polymerase V
MLPTVETIFRRTPSAPCYLTLYDAPVPAGFPSPADDYTEHSLDLNEYLVKHPAATFFVRVRGQSMIGAGIHDGDLLVVDRALEPRDGNVVIAIVDGDLTVKRIRRRDGKMFLCPENDAYPAIEVSPETGLRIWGVVAHAIHPV